MCSGTVTVMLTAANKRVVNGGETVFCAEATMSSESVTVLFVAANMTVVERW